MEITGMISPEPMDIFNQQMAGLCALQDIPWKKIKILPRKPIADRAAPNTRRTLRTLAVVGMCDGLAQMLMDQEGKKLLPGYGRELNRVCTDALNYWGRIDLRGGKNIRIPKGVAELDRIWREHRQSPLVFATMLIPMVADCSVDLKQAQKPDARKIVFLEEVECILVRVYRYYEQRGKADVGRVNYAEGLYREWLRITA